MRRIAFPVRTPTSASPARGTLRRSGRPPVRARAFQCRGLRWVVVLWCAHAMPMPATGSDTTGDRDGIPPELVTAEKSTTVIEALRPVAGFDRHDPSNIVLHDGRYWVFYTRNVDDHREVSVHFASSEDGLAWVDHGEALGHGPAGAWDESGTIAPYVVPHDGRFHLFYTGFRNGDLATRDLGCAIADSPAGPWNRCDANPILRRSTDPEAWDSGMLGDSNVVFRKGRWWLYFKSRRADESSSETRIGVAVADHLTGPYRKHPANPLFAGHAFSAWVHRDGIAALCGVVSPAVKWSPDGIHFVDAGEMPNTSTGLYCPANLGDGTNPHGVRWGLERYTENGTRGLRRFDCTMSVQPDQSDAPRPRNQE